MDSILLCLEVAGDLDGDPPTHICLYVAVVCVSHTAGGTFSALCTKTSPVLPFILAILLCREQLNLR